MSARRKKEERRARGASGGAELGGKRGDQAAGAGDAEPLKPRKGLLITLSIIFAVWVMALLVMYFTTIYPKHSHPTSSGVAALLGL